jgi:hypothetical protein
MEEILHPEIIRELAAAARKTLNLAARRGPQTDRTVARSKSMFRYTPYFFTKILPYGHVFIGLIKDTHYQYINYQLHTAS